VIVVVRPSGDRPRSCRPGVGRKVRSGVGLTPGRRRVDTRTRKRPGGRWLGPDPAGTPVTRDHVHQKQDQAERQRQKPEKRPHERGQPPRGGTTVPPRLLGEEVPEDPPPHGEDQQNDELGCRHMRHIPNCTPRRRRRVGRDGSNPSIRNPGCRCGGGWPGRRHRDRRRSTGLGTRRSPRTSRGRH
jgi:hypothetical protein